MSGTETAVPKTDAAPRRSRVFGLAPRRCHRVCLLVILCLGAVLRCANVTLPPVDYHSWRQTETAALARNYAAEGYRLFYPTVDWRGHTEGYVESELSLYAFTVALLYGVLGFNEAWARLLTILVTAITGYLLAGIAARIWTRRAGLFTALVFTFLSPFSLFFGQAIMGDMTVLLCVTLAVYAGLRWMEQAAQASESPTRGWGWFLLMGGTLAAGGLSKLPALYIAAPLAVLLFLREGWRMVRKPRNWALALVSIGLVAAWYAHAYRLGTQTGLTFGIWGSNKVGNWDLLRDVGFYRALWFNFSRRLLAPQVFVFMGLGLVLPYTRRTEAAPVVWLLSVLAYLLYAGIGVLGQDYYTLALLPPVSLLAGKALNWIYERITIWGWRPTFRYPLAAFALFGLSTFLLLQASVYAGNTAAELFTPSESAWGFWEGGHWIQAATPPDAGLIVVGASPPEGLYFSHRHGLWYEDDALAAVPTADWPYALLLNPYYGDFPTLTDLPVHWRLIGGGQWFLAYDLQQQWPATPTHPLAEVPQWGGQISLLGYDFIPDQLVNGKLYLVLHWRAAAQPEAALVGFVHVWNSQGDFCGQDDHQPLRGRLATETWAPGQIVLDPFEVDVSECGPATEALRVSTGLYRAADITRIPLTSWPNADQLYWFEIAPSTE
ncbi:MAG: glycosyltransferase family 39 protein [Anaerolineae bacterium]|nr:glycosyltransferase family 39 protein [Anaerolineae bacterium]